MLAGLVFHASHRRSGQGTGMAVGDQGGQCRSVWPRWWKYVRMQGGSQIAKRYGHLEPFQHLGYSVLVSGVYQGRVTMVSAVWYTPSSCSHGYRNLQITVKIIHNIQCNLDWWNIEPAMFLLSTLTIEVFIEISIGSKFWPQQRFQVILVSFTMARQGWAPVSFISHNRQLVRSDFTDAVQKSGGRRVSLCRFSRVIWLARNFMIAVVFLISVTC